MKDLQEEFDVVVVGGGPGGMSAAIWCVELGLKTVLLEASAVLGGQLHSTFNPVENYLGLNAKNGSEVAERFREHVSEKRLDVRLNTAVERIEVKHQQVVTNSFGTLGFRSLVLATGVRRRRLGVPGENRFRGKGIITSGKRDAELVRAKHVAIIGGGDAAFENTEILSETADKLTLIHRRDEFSARDEFTRAANENPKLSILRNKVVTSIDGKNSVEVLNLKDVESGESSVLLIDALLVRIGVEPASELLAGQVTTDDRGYVKTDTLCCTSIPGIYAIGDVANPVSPTISTASGTGSTAAKAIREHIR